MTDSMGVSPLNHISTPGYQPCFHVDFQSCAVILLLYHSVTIIGDVSIDATDDEDVVLVDLDYFRPHGPSYIIFGGFERFFWLEDLF